MVTDEFKLTAYFQRHIFALTHLKEQYIRISFRNYSTGISIKRMENIIPISFNITHW
jgi:hypothetical protein